MSYTVYPAAGRKTVQWSGGTSTEIFVSPSDGDFATRNFDFRISTATVEVEASDFTFFEGITRHLMILEGMLELNHIDRYEKTLQSYDQDTFSGEWPTKSRGKVTDFNLMLKNGYTGRLEHVQVAAGEHVYVKPVSRYNFIYLAEGEMEISGRKLQRGDLLEFDEPVTLLSIGSAHVICIDVLSSFD